MKFTLEIELGNDAMQTSKDVREAITDSLGKGQLFIFNGKYQGNDSQPIFDINGNNVGKWEVMA